MSVFNSPFYRQGRSVRRVMLTTLAALTPGIAVYVWVFGGAILLQIALATLTALSVEILCLRLRDKPVWLFASDGSAILTAWLLALALPSTSPWWLVVVGVAFALIVVKHLYGGLGQNPFNPAMAAWCLLIISWPQLMSQWPAAGELSFAHQWESILGSAVSRSPMMDALVSATPLDHLRTTLHHTPGTAQQVLADSSRFGALAGIGWQWIALAWAAGGLILLQQRIISWHIPLVFLASLATLAGLAHWADPTRYAGALFHLFSGGAMLGAFFILTDPVSAASTPRGKMIYAAVAALLTWIIRCFGAYPDGLAFAVLLMNIAVPLLNRYAQPPVFGHKR
jgi:electron transport complex protein RnfD